jgi:NADH:ubiquinone oxidoreductase subunit K
MIFAIPVLIGAIGLGCLVLRRTLPGVIVGIQILFLGSSMIFVLGGLRSGVAGEGHLFAAFIVVAGLAQVIGAYGLAMRMFVTRRHVRMDELRTLKR